MFNEAAWHAILSNIPLVVFLIAAVLSILALFVRRGPFNLILFILTVIGTIGLYVGIITGQAALKAYEVSHEMAHKLLSEHEHLAMRVMIIALVATVSTLIQMLLAYFKPQKVYRIISILSLVLLVSTSLITLQVVKKGTDLVYKYGIGVEKSEGSRIQHHDKDIEKVHSQSGA